MMQELGANLGNVPDPNLFPAVSAALDEMGIDIAQGANEPEIDQLIKSLFALSARALEAPPVMNTIADFIRKPEEE